MTNWQLLYRHCVREKDALRAKVTGVRDDIVRYDTKSKPIPQYLRDGSNFYDRLTAALSAHPAPATVLMCMECGKYPAEEAQTVCEFCMGISPAPVPVQCSGDSINYKYLYRALHVQLETEYRYLNSGTWLNWPAEKIGGVIKRLRTALACAPPEAAGASPLPSPGIDPVKVREVREGLVDCQEDLYVSGKDENKPCVFECGNSLQEHIDAITRLLTAAGKQEPRPVTASDFVDGIFRRKVGESDAYDFMIDGMKQKAVMTLTGARQCLLDYYMKLGISSAIYKKVVKPQEPVVPVSVIDKALKDAPRIEKRRKAAQGIYVRESNILARLESYRRPAPDAADAFYGKPDTTLADIKASKPLADAPPPVPTTQERAEWFLEHSIAGDDPVAARHLANVLKGKHDTAVRAWLTERDARSDKDGE